MQCFVEIGFVVVTGVGSSVESGFVLWTGGGSGSVEMWFGTGCSGGNWCGTSVEFLFWGLVEIGCAMERRGRFVRGVSGNQR